MLNAIPAASSAVRRLAADTAPTTGAASAGASSTATNSTPTAASASQPGGAMGKTQFLQLLVAQMKNQDPLNPMDGTQMASQLAQFSTVEQLQNANDTLTQIAAAVRVANGASGSASGAGSSTSGSSASGASTSGPSASGSSGAVANGA